MKCSKRWLKNGVAALGLALLLQCVSRDALASNEELHGQLTSFRETIIRAVNENRYKDVLPLLNPELVLTAENGRVAWGKESVEKFYDEMLGSPAAPLKQFQVEGVEVDKLSVIHHGNTAIAAGSARYSYRFKNGDVFSYPARWTATLVLDDGKWTLAGFHNAVNFADNIVIDRLKQSLYVSALAALIVGLVVGNIVGRRKAAK